MAQATPPSSRIGGADPASPADPLRGRRVLVVEDNPFIALALEEILTERELIVVGVARTLDQALTAAKTLEFDVALLDVNIGGEKTTGVADALKARDAPFVFATGYGRAGLPEGYAEHALIEKPFYIDEILNALRAAIAVQAPGKTATRSSP